MNTKTGSFHHTLHDNGIRGEEEVKQREILRGKDCSQQIKMMGTLSSSTLVDRAATDKQFTKFKRQIRKKTTKKVSFYIAGDSPLKPLGFAPRRRKCHGLTYLNGRNVVKQRRDRQIKWTAARIQQDQHHHQHTICLAPITYS